MHGVFGCTCIFFFQPCSWWWGEDTGRWNWMPRLITNATSSCGSGEKAVPEAFRRSVPFSIGLVCCCRFGHGVSVICPELKTWTIHVGWCRVNQPGSCIEAHRDHEHPWLDRRAADRNRTLTWRERHCELWLNSQLFRHCELAVKLIRKWPWCSNSK
jgi:hypothetical protein